MPRQKARFILGIALGILVIAICASGPFRFAFSFPLELTVLLGEDFVIDTGSPMVRVQSPDALGSEGLSTRLWVDTETPKVTRVSFRLFGLIPIRQVSLTVAPPIMVTPGGHSIGVLLRSGGLLVTGTASVLGDDGREVWPARSAGVSAGDVVISVNDRKVSSKEEFAALVDRAGRQGVELDLLLQKSDGSMLRCQVRPVKSRAGQYQVGLLMKDVLAGVGTLTFYDGTTGLYAALGHVITDGDSKKPAQMSEGHIVRANVTGIEPSRKGIPGAFLGTFVEGRDVLGSILQNGECGIAGILNEPLVNEYYPEPIPLAEEGSIRKGPAEMLTTVEGSRIERFHIEIGQILQGTGMTSKGFMVTVTDERLLGLTGGIVQGMSGSPIIQDGRLVGAITHVLVNDPRRGYGTMAAWMAKAAFMSPGLGEGRNEEDIPAMLPLATPCD